MTQLKSNFPKMFGKTKLPSMGKGGKKIKMPKLTKVKMAQMKMPKFKKPKL